MHELKINPQFRDLIPPLADHEREGLEEDIKHYGCYCPIVTWQGYIIDGHHRYEICMKHKLSFRVEEREFEDEDAVMIWMIDNQASNRRNLTTAAKIRLSMKKMDIFKNQARKRMLSGKKLDPSLDRGQGNRKSAEEVAKDAGVSRAVVDCC